ncbi:MAG: hypothetical protein D6785_04585, partial [Planctomycetota bacterium]
MEKKDQTFFKIFLAVMVLLATMMVILTIYTYSQLKKQRRELFYQAQNLSELKEKIQDPQFRALLERKKKTIASGRNNQYQIKKLINQIVNREGNLRNIGYNLSDTEKKGIIKESYTIQIDNITMRGLVFCLYYLEQLPGAKIENLYLEKKKDQPRP